ncbi:efflux RND transporter periplasmic adaptor subunit [Thermomonas sp.]|uniref:efflux RND transporter periplasmic adaptor subunit n=1 Tax=Thermomonas sp. TaxID=1971895 RepID=UPI0035B13ADA
MKRMVLAAALAASLAACGSDKPTAPPRLADVPTFVVAAAGGAPGRGWDGVVEAVRRSDLSAQTAGRVTAVEVDVNDRVAAGDVLLRISAVEQNAGANAARAQLRAAEASAVEAEQHYRRFAALASGQYVSKAQIDQARAARDSAAAARDAARAVVAQAAQQSAYTVVRAPFAGVVASRDVEPGETVAPGKPLMRVYEPRELRIEVAVPQTRAEAIRRDPRARVVLPGGREVVPAEVTVFPAADAASHSVNVRVRLPDLDPPPAPGTTAKVVFDAEPGNAGDTGARSVRIPLSAVAQHGELSGAYVQQGDRLLLRQLRLGARLGDSVEVISGLQAGDRVARDPVAAMQALAAQRKQAGAGDE